VRASVRAIPKTCGLRLTASQTRQQTQFDGALFMLLLRLGFWPIVVEVVDYVIETALSHVIRAVIVRRAGRPAATPRITLSDGRHAGYAHLRPFI
jgi:hypothetical protein